MASTIVDADIQRKALPLQTRNLLSKINDSAATATDVHESLVSLAEKEICLALVAGTATRQQIMASLNVPPFKEVALAIANV